MPRLPSGSISASARLCRRYKHRVTVLIHLHDLQDLTWVESSPYFGSKGGAEWEVRPSNIRFVRALSTQ